MDYPYRVFYTVGVRGHLTVSDARIVERDGGVKVFHTDDDKVRAIKSSADETRVLDEDGEMEETRVEHVWEKLNEHELYLYGGGYYATECEVYYHGDYNGRVSFEGGVSLRINDTEVSGSGNYDNRWDWNVVTEGGSSLVEVNDELSEVFGKECVYIGYDGEVDTFEFFSSII